MDKAKRWSSVHLGDNGHMALTDVVSAQDYDDLYRRWERQRDTIKTRRYGLELSPVEQGSACNRDLFTALLQSQVAHLKETLFKEQLKQQPSGPYDIERRLSAVEEKLVADKELPRHYNDVVGKLCDIRKILDDTPSSDWYKLQGIRKVLDR